MRNILKALTMLLVILSGTFVVNAAEGVPGGFTKTGTAYVMLGGRRFEAETLLIVDSMVVQSSRVDSIGLGTMLILAKQGVLKSAGETLKIHIQGTEEEFRFGVSLDLEKAFTEEVRELLANWLFEAIGRRADSEVDLFINITAK